MQSPFTGGPTTLRFEKKQLEYRKELFQIIQFFYSCDDTKEEFTTEEIDQLNLNQLYNQYREKYCIPFPDEIRDIREQYEAPASKMSEILGFGANTYRQYESGDIPTVANGRLILAAKDPDEFKNFIKASHAILNPKEYHKFISRVDALIADSKRDDWDRLFTNQIFAHSKPSEYTGYKNPSLAKIAHTISFFAQNTDNLWKAKLNKLLFYSDFLHYKRTGYSICGIAYRAIQLGPVPAEYETLCQTN